MVTFTDAPASEFPSLEAFLAARRIVRAAAADQLLALRADQSKALESLAKEFEQLRESISMADVGMIDRVALSLDLRSKHNLEESALRGQFDGKINSLYDRYSLSRTVRQQNASDVRDYLHATDAFREDLRADGVAQLDPMLEQLPGVRRRREDGWTVYEAPQMHGILGQRELLRCDATQIIVRGSDDDRIKAGLLVASQRYAPPIKITGTPEFVRRSQAAADSLGISYELESRPTQAQGNTASAPEPSHGRAEGAEQSAPAASYTLSPSDERLQNLKDKYDAKFAASISKLGGTEVSGVVKECICDFWPDADALVLLRDRSVLAVPVRKGADFVNLLGKEVRLIPDGAQCAVEPLDNAHDHEEPANDVEHEMQEPMAPTRSQNTGRGR